MNDHAFLVRQEHAVSPVEDLIFSTIASNEHGAARTPQQMVPERLQYGLEAIVFSGHVGTDDESKPEKLRHHGVHDDRHVHPLVTKSRHVEDLPKRRPPNGGWDLFTCEQLAKRFGCQLPPTL